MRTCEWHAKRKYHIEGSCYRKLEIVRVSEGSRLETSIESMETAATLINNPREFVAMRQVNAPSSCSQVVSRPEPIAVQGLVCREASMGGLPYKQQTDATESRLYLFDCKNRLGYHESAKLQ